MPSIVTRGAMAARSLGLSAATGGSDGTVAIFALGNSSGSLSTRNKYTYATCASTASGVGAASVASYYGSAAGNGSRGIFALGWLCAPAGPSTTRNKYTYATCGSTASGVGAASAASYKSSATGNSTRGIFALGRACCITSDVRDKYTYATCGSTAAGVAKASAASSDGSAAGNSTRGIFALGDTTTLVTTRNKYTYASCTNTSSGVGAASVVSSSGAAAGTKLAGIFALGRTSAGNITTREKYTYASCTSTACGVAVASEKSNYGAAAGNSTRGIFALGLGAGNTPTSTRNKYTYASCTSTASGVGASSAASAYQSATSWASCVNCGA